MQNTPQIDAIVERIRKCLALANGRNATPGEMSAAMGKAKEIAMRYGIEIASIAQRDVSGGKKPTDFAMRNETVALRSKRTQKYHPWIARVLRDVFGIRIIFGYNELFFLGEATDVEICKLLFPWLEDVFYSTYYKGMKEGRWESCAASKNGVYAGLARGIVEANKRAEATLAKAEAQTWAVVVRNKTQAVELFTAQQFPNVRDMKSRQKQIGHTAYAAGVVAGRQINLRQTQAPAQTTRPLIG